MDHASHANGTNGASCCAPRHRIDWLLWTSSMIIIIFYGAHFLAPDIVASVPYGTSFATSIVALLHQMWHGILLGIIFVGILDSVPKELVFSVLCSGGAISGIFRATAGGVLLDLCSHGILLIGMQLYRRGASLGQMMAFLIASPWNSLSLTVILWALVGLKWTVMVLGLSLVIAIFSGVFFDWLVARGVLPENPNSTDMEHHKGFFTELMLYVRGITYTPLTFLKMLKTGLSESRMILRWIFFGIVLAALIRTTVPLDLFSSVFGPTLLGLGATLIFATVLEVCSEGSIPVAADFLLRARAPGNMFAFLMTGVSTDYTEIMALRETTGRWKIAFFLPLVTVPQVVLVALLLNAVHF